MRYIWLTIFQCLGARNQFSWREVCIPLCTTHLPSFSRQGRIHNPPPERGQLHSVQVHIPMKCLYSNTYDSWVKTWMKKCSLIFKFGTYCIFSKKFSRLLSMGLWCALDDTNSAVGSLYMDDGESIGMSIPSLCNSLNRNLENHNICSSNLIWSIKISVFL